MHFVVQSIHSAAHRGLGGSLHYQRGMTVLQQYSYVQYYLNKRSNSLTALALLITAAQGGGVITQMLCYVFLVFFPYR